MKNVLEYLKEAAVKYAEKTAVISEDRQITFEGLFREAVFFGVKIREAEPEALLRVKGMNTPAVESILRWRETNK